VQVPDHWHHRHEWEDDDHPTRRTDAQCCGVKTVAAGNIGPAFSARVKQSKDLDVMTLEISSFQLETDPPIPGECRRLARLCADHLDRYPSMEEYYEAKIRIFENQTEDDWAVVNYRDKLPDLRARRITFSAFAEGADFGLQRWRHSFRGEAVLRLADTQLRGAHNAENLMAALGSAFTQGLTFEQMRAPLCEYKPLPHRCEKIRTLGKWNGSTIPRARILIQSRKPCSARRGRWS
jgi:UDP-N-acetylmuramoylalanine--D-glutamate ligase